MQDNTQPPSRSKDPAEVWWADAAGTPQHTYQPMIESAPLQEPWRWRYSWMFGIMYGPIPVGLFIALLLFLISMT